MTTSSDITFENGYRRLQEIADRLGSDEVPVHEMCDLFAEGKGLEHALAAYLSDQKARVEAIERGEGMRAFRVVPPGGELPAAPEPNAAEGPPLAVQGEAPAEDGAAAEADAQEPPPQDEVLPF